ncbi:MAG: transposase family protein, partial [Actinobacteria bacterium]|nr:transposase family protein [Actinomycetota bacterium]
VHGDRSRQPRRAEGYGVLFAAVDDASRLGFARLYPDETAASARAFLRALASFYAAHGIAVERILTDNGSCFRRRWAEACERRGIRAKRTRPYRPQTNGEVERFLRTLLGEWAYVRSYAHEDERQAALASYLESSNRRRPHRALGGQTPLQRVNNLSGTNT